ncbi:MAG: hypothetical protein C4289_16465, partial [Chloroflexota bacterium]
TTGLAPAPADPYFQQSLEQPDDVLRRRFDQLKQQAKELVSQLAAMPAQPADTGEPAQVETVLLALPDGVEYQGSVRGEQPVAR